MFAWARALGSGGSSPRVAGALLRQALCKRTGVLVVELCDERRLNAFTIPMIEQLCAALSHAACSDAVRGVVVTGRGRYYSAGADLSSVLTFRRPSHLVSQLRDTNQGLFDSFIKFPKPIVAAVNGPAFGAAVTSATLMDAVVASETATFSLPFAKYGVPPEGCSSVVLKELIGEECAIRMMGTENWAPTAFEAASLGLIQEVVQGGREKLVDRATELCIARMSADAKRRFDDAERTKLLIVNAEESAALANAFVSTSFLSAMYRFNLKRNKPATAYAFLLANALLPLWQPEPVIPVLLGTR